MSLNPKIKWGVIFFAIASTGLALGAVVLFAPLPWRGFAGLPLVILAAFIRPASRRWRASRRGELKARSGP